MTERRNYQENDDDVFQALFTTSRAGGGGRGSGGGGGSPPEERSEDEDRGGGKERNRFQESETKLLEKWFDKNPYPNKEERTLISELMNLPEKKVRIWFQNKRCKTDDGKIKCFFARNNITAETATTTTTASPPVTTTSTASSSADFDKMDDDIHTCPTCKQSFVGKLDLRIHVNRVHGGDGEKVVCKDCLKTFDSLWNLKTHCIEQHAKSGKNSEEKFYN